MSETLKTILNHWTDEEQFQGETGHLDLPFDIEAFCIEMDNRIRELEQPWISVDERLPETFDNGYGWAESVKVPVLVSSEQTGPVERWHCAVFNNKSNYDFWQIHGFLGDFKVTHWMPLPEPPK